MLHRGDVLPESTARAPASIAVLQNRAFVELSRVLASGDSAVLSTVLPLLVRGSGVPSAAIYGISEGDEMAFAAADGVPLKLRAYLEEPGYSGALDFLARRASKQRRTVIDSAVFGAATTAGVLAALEEAAWQSGIAVPILAGGASVGVILAGARAGAASGSTVSFLEAMANLLGAALRKAPPAPPPIRLGVPVPSAGVVALVYESLTALGREVATEQELVKQIGLRKQAPPEADALLGHSRVLDRSFRRLADAVLHLPGAAGAQGKGSVLMTQVIEVAVRAAEAPLTAARAEVQVVCAHSCALEGDPELITLALRQLVMNAAEAMGATTAAPGAPTSRKLVRIRARIEGPHAIVDVEDSGLGVPHDLRARVFDTAVTTKGAGRGIGLALARRVVEAHGGWMELGASELGGARFSLRLPLRAASIEARQRAPTLPQIPTLAAPRRTNE